MPTCIHASAAPWNVLVRGQSELARCERALGPSSLEPRFPKQSSGTAPLSTSAHIESVTHVKQVGNSWQQRF